MFLRILTVLAASTTGLGAGSLIYYSFLEDNMIYRGGPRSALVGQGFSIAAIAVFLTTVYLLHLNEISAIVVSAVGMALTKLLWDIGDGLRYAGRIHDALASLTQDQETVVQFVERADSYRQTQDLRSVAKTVFAPNSRQMILLDQIIVTHSRTDTFR